MISRTRAIAGRRGSPPSPRTASGLVPLGRRDDNPRGESRQAAAGRASILRPRGGERGGPGARAGVAGRGRSRRAARRGGTGARSGRGRGTDPGWGVAGDRGAVVAGGCRLAEAGRDAGRWSREIEGGRLGAAAPAGDHAAGALVRGAPAGLSLRLHAARGADAGLGDRAGPAGDRGDRCRDAQGAAVPGTEGRQRVRAVLPRLCHSRAAVGLGLGLASRERAEDAAAGRGARALADVRCRAGQRADGRARDAAAPGFDRFRGDDLLRRVAGDARGGGARRGGEGRDPGDAGRAPGRAREGRRRLFRARAGAVAAARAGAAGRPRAQPGARGRGPRRGERAALLRARGVAGGGCLPAGAGRDRPSRARGRALLLLRGRPAVSLLLPPVLPGDARVRWRSRSRSGRWPFGRSGSGSTPGASARSWHSCRGCTRSSCRCGAC